MQRGFKVGIMDTDVQSPGIHILFQLQNEKIKHTLNEYLHGTCKIEETAYDVTPKDEPKGKLLVIPASMNSKDITLILRDGYEVSVLCDGFVRLLKELHLDYLIIDTHPGLNEETLLAMTISDLLFVVLRPDEQDILGTAITLEVARKLGISSAFIILNKVLEGHALKELEAEVEKKFKAPVKAVFPLAEEFVSLGSRDLFVRKYPDHPITQEIRQLADAV